MVLNGGLYQNNIFCIELYVTLYIISYMDILELEKLHKETSKKCLDIMLKKNSDYTGGEKSTDIFANFRSSEYLGIHPVIGIMMRVMDKIQRIRSFTADGKLKVDNESIDDACEDVVNYMILTKAIFKEQREKNENNS